MASVGIDSWALWLSPAVLGVFGLLVGSFLNVVIHRLPLMMERDWLGEVAGVFADLALWKRVLGRDRPPAFAPVGEQMTQALEALAPLGLATPRSRCPSCGHQIRWFENLPVVSWIALRGRCSACKTRISARYPVIEIATGVLFALVAWRFGPQPATLAWCAVVAALVAMTLIDLDTMLLPDSLTLPMLWGGLIAAAVGWTIPLPTAVWGAAAGYLSLWTISTFFAKVMRRDGMGTGDMKLLAALGAWLGWQAILPIALMASIVGLCVTVPKRILGRMGPWEHYPFGPFLAGGGLVVMLVGVDRCLEWLGLH